MMISPRRTQDALSSPEARPPDNLALRLYALVPGELVAAQGNEKTEAYKAMQGTSGVLLDGGLLQALAQRQDEAARSLCRPGHVPGAGAGVRQVPLKLTANLTCGMSQPTLLENGLMLLRPYGIPIVPSTGVKGPCASWLAEVLTGELNLTKKRQVKALEDAGLLDLFGDSPDDDEDGSPARVIFFDALPTDSTLRVDITTAHHQSWYQECKPPAGFENPTPVPFLTVAKGTTFNFCFLVLDAATLNTEALQSENQNRLGEFGITHLDSPANFIEDLLRSTGRYKGFGSQTARGYGRMT